MKRTELERGLILRLEAAELRAGILEGYQDAIAGRATPFSGNLKADMVQFRKRGS